MANIKMPLMAQLELTSKCNLRCLHCYRLDHHFSNNNSKELYDEAIMFLADKMVEADLFDVVLTGGEPLLKKNLVMRLIKYFKDNNMHVSLNTNFLLSDQSILEELTAYKLDGLLISCSSGNPTIYKQMTGGGDYFRFESNLKAVVNKGMHFSVNMVVNKLNLRSIKDTACWLKSLGVERFGATPMGLNVEYPEMNLFLDIQDVRDVVKDLIWVHDNLQMKVDIFEALPKCVFPNEAFQKDFGFLRRKCQAGRTAIAIASNGDVRPCTHNLDVYGNLFEESLDVIWNRMSRWRTGVFVPDECRQCKIVNMCFGGCRTTAKAFAGNWRCKDPWMDASLEEIPLRKELNILPDIKADALITPLKIRWRKEGGDAYLICTKTIKNMLLVNEELFRFVLDLQEITSIKLCDLANICKTKFNDVNFQRVIKLLVKKGFISVKKGGESNEES